MGTRVDLCVFFCFNVKIPFTSCDSYGYSLVARWWLVCWSTEHHYYWKNWLWKTPFSNQYFVLCSWYLITLSMRLGIDSMPLSIISVGKAKTVWIILFENWLKVSLVRFLLTASSLSFLPIRWKTFSIRLRSGERAGILKKWHPTFSIAYLHTLRFFERSLSWKNNLPFLKHIRKLFFDKLYKLFSINSPFVLVTFNNTFTMWYSHHELCYASSRTFFFPFAQHASLRSWLLFLHVLVRNVFAWDAGLLLWTQEVSSR